MYFAVEGNKADKIHVKNFTIELCDLNTSIRLKNINLYAAMRSSFITKNAFISI